MALLYTGDYNGKGVLITQSTNKLLLKRKSKHNFLPGQKSIEEYHFKGTYFFTNLWKIV